MTNERTLSDESIAQILEADSKTKARRLAGKLNATPGITKVDRTLIQEAAGIKKDNRRARKGDGIGPVEMSW